MRSFYRKVILFVVIFGVICILADHMSSRDPWRRVIARYTDSEEFISVNVGPSEIKPYIEKVQTEDDTTRLILGDSVCKQLFGGLQEENEGFCIAGSNAALTMAGQYILLHEYVENHAEATDVYLILLPGSLEASFNTTWGYQYSVMPFVETDTIRLLEDSTLEAMEAVYGKLFMKKAVVEWIDDSAVNRKLYLNALDSHSEGYQQQKRFEIAEQYIKKMYELCEENGISLHLYPCPVSEKNKEGTEAFKDAFRDTWLYEKFPDYTERILYYSEEQSADGVHFAGEFATQECYNEKIETIFNGSELLNELDLE